MTTNIIAVSGHGIQILTNNVTVDLNGFMLQGAGASAGVAVPGVRTNIVVRNGTIRGFGNGISAPQIEGGRFEGLQISHNGGSGLRVGSFCSIYACNVYTNAGFGVEAQTGAQMRIVWWRTTVLEGSMFFRRRASGVVRCEGMARAGSQPIRGVW